MPATNVGAKMKNARKCPGTPLICVMPLMNSHYVPPLYVFAQVSYPSRLGLSPVRSLVFCDHLYPLCVAGERREFVDSGFGSRQQYPQ